MTGITALVPTYNRPQLLRACVSSLIDQTRPVAEILVIDDGSDEEVAPALADLSGPIRVLRQPNRGKSAALNLGLAQARGDYIWICDDDDLALPDAAERLGAVLDGSDAGFAYGGLLRFREDPATGERKVYGPGYWPGSVEPQELFATLLDDFFIFQFGTLVRRSAYAAVGPFREDMVRSQDYDMILRLARAFEGRPVDGPVFLQREHDGPRGSKADRFKALQATERWIEYDQRLFRELHGYIPLAEFAPAGLADASPSVRRRAAHLKRGCVLARRKLWALAMRDLQQAVNLGGAGPPTAPEVTIASRILAGKYGCHEVLQNRELLQSLAEAFRVRPYGQTLRAHVARPLRWRARDALLSARRREGVDYLVAALRFMGLLRGAFWLLGAASRAILKLFRRRPAARDAPCAVTA